MPDQPENIGTTTLLPDGKAEVALSTGKKVVIHELDGLEQANADGCVSTSQAHLIAYYRTAFSIDAIDGQPLPPVVGKPTLDARLKRLKGREADELSFLYNRLFGAPFPDDVLKNVSAPGSSTPNS